jgi:hypothetical protein
MTKERKSPLLLSVLKGKMTNQSRKMKEIQMEKDLKEKKAGLKKSPAKAEVYKDSKITPLTYVIESLDFEDKGEVLSIRFTGTNAKELALEYAKSKFEDYKLL